MFLRPVVTSRIRGRLMRTVAKPVLSDVQPKSSEQSSALLDVDREHEHRLKLAMPFDDMPGPLILKILAKVWYYAPVPGTRFAPAAMTYLINILGANLIWNRAARPFNHMFQKYGPVVRLQGPFGGDILFLSRPEHMEAVFRQEGDHPVRSAISSLEEYRLHRKLPMAGPFVTSGLEWQSLRTKMELPLHRSAVQYCDELDAIADEFLARIRVLRSQQQEMPADFHTEIYKWSLECVCLMIFGQRLGALQSDRLAPSSETARLLAAMLSASAALRRCEAGFQLWRFLPTAHWKALVSSCDAIVRIVTARARSTHAREDASASLLETLLLGEDANPEDALTVVLDMLLIGVNATAHAMGFLLYHLAQWPRVQQRLARELCAVLPSKQARLSLAEARQLEFLHACVKESLRLRPPIPVLTRVLPREVALHGYKVPSGTHVLMTGHVTALREENFQDAPRYKPERWLRDDGRIHPLAAIPFGHGPRACPARGLAELQLWLLAAKLVRNFRVEYHYGAIRPSERFIAMPDKPLKFRFVDRDD